MTVQSDRRDDQEEYWPPANFWKYWAASTISMTGAGVSVVALPLTAISVLDASDFEVGVLTAASYAATVFIGLPAGVIVQRFALRRLQVTLDLFRAVAVLTLPVAAWWGVLTLPHMLVAAFLVGLASNLFDVANATYLPQVVPKDQLTARNGLISGTYSATQLVGPALGGVLVQAVGAAVSLILDALSYLVSAVLLARIPATGQSTPATSHDGYLNQVMVGLRFLARHPVMRPAVIAGTVMNFAVGGILAVTPPFLVRTLELPLGSVGLVMAVDGLGALVGASLTAWLVARLGSARALLVALPIGSVLALAMPLATRSWATVFGVGMAALGATVVILGVITRTHRQVASPPHLLSRVIASARFVSWSAIPLGAALAGAAAQAWGPRVALAAACLASMLAPAAIWFSQIRRLRDLADADLPAPA
ncbi:MFS transporter [Micromonospora sp. NBRC 101691]|uniref:MFS transporter n=1 Tax=Micromonospora TaxID=1873 RepID=UPI0024A51ACB|nr:MFS transporter [Micromonospora sp. NBRC 101691]GLY26199.1 MFS transporter [Micromonospora sp. NBRC 101691]